MFSSIYWSENTLKVKFISIKLLVCDVLKWSNRAAVVLAQRDPAPTLRPHWTCSLCHCQCFLLKSLN